MNNGHYDSPEYKNKLRAATDKRLGPIMDHSKVCERCESDYVFTGRKKTKSYERSRFCSRSCANSVGGNAKREKYGLKDYRKICFEHHGKQCIICGFDKIVVAHHIDENHSNNDPKNLMPLCPNHHEMWHSKWKDEVLGLLNGSDSALARRKVRIVTG